MTTNLDRARTLMETGPVRSSDLLGIFHTPPDGWRFHTKRTGCNCCMRTRQAIRKLNIKLGPDGTYAYADAQKGPQPEG